MKSYQCKNCGAELVKTDDGYTCQYCKQIYTEDSLEQAYQKICQTLQSTVQGVVSEELLREKLERIAYCRQELYKTCMGEYVNSEDVGYWAKQILKQNPEDVQANFFLIASTERWIELNKFLANFNAKENAYLLKGFVRYLTNGRFVEKCALRLNDLISKAFEENSEEYKACHKMIIEATENAESGVFDPSLPRDVFVAYSSKDSQKAYEIVEYLEERGLNCFISMRNLPKGVNAERYYEERLKQAIDNCQVFLFVSSKNSRSRYCDAYSLEIDYVKKSDLKNSGNVNYFNGNYDLYFENNRKKCKPRVEWLIDDYGNSIYETEVKKFFKGLSWCVDEESVLGSIADYITNNPMAAAAQADDEFARQKEEFAKQKAEIERQRAELEKLKSERERQNADERARQQAEIERQKAESERQQLEFEKQKMEIERQKLEFEKQKMEIERQKAALANAKPVETPVAPPPVVGITLHNELYDIQDGVLTKYKGKEMFPIVPEGTITIAPYAFSDNDAMYTISLADTVRTIKSNAITNCSKLVNVNIPKFVEKIERNAICPIRDNFIVYAESTSQPSGWENGWDAKCPEIEWGSKFGASKNRGKQSAQPTPPPVVPALTLNNDDFEIVDGVLKRYKGKDWLVFVPEGTLSVASYAFYKCELYTVSLPPTVTKVQKYAFYNCSKMVSVELPASVTEIAADAFYGCSPKFGVYAQAVAPSKGWESGWDNGCANVKYAAKVSHPLKDTPAQQPKPEEKPAAATKPKTTTTTAKPAAKVPEKITNTDFEIENGVLKKYKGDGWSVVFVPEGTLSIASYAFSDQEFLSVSLPPSVTTIHTHAFHNCSKMKNIILLSSVTEIEEDAFYGCNPKFQVHAQATEAPSGWKFGWNNGCANVKMGLKVIKPYDSKAISKRLSAIDANKFEIENGVLKRYWGMKSDVVIPKGIKEIGKEAFYECDELKSVEIPNTVTTISELAFVRCKNLTSVKIPDSVKAIGMQAFAGCENLGDIVIPASVTDIGGNAFMYCTKSNLFSPLKEKPQGWKIGAKPVVWGYGTTGEKSAQKQELSKNEEEAWKDGAVAWIDDWVDSLKKTETKPKAEAKPVEIKQPAFSDRGLDYAIKNAGNLLSQVKKDVQRAKAQAETKPVQNPDFEIKKDGTLVKYKGNASVVKIPDTVKSIGAYAFQYCSKVTSVELPDKLTSIGPNAFEGSSLASITIPKNVTSIHTYAFKACYSLRAIVFDETSKLKILGSGAFESCKNLQEIKIPRGVTLIDNQTFNNCTSLKSVDLHSNLKEIGTEAFKNCTSLRSILIYDSVENIGNSAFANCSRMFSISTTLKKKPKGWVQSLFGKENWNPDKIPVHWNFLKK